MSKEIVKKFKKDRAEARKIKRLSAKIAKKKLFVAYPKRRK